MRTENRSRPRVFSYMSDGFIMIDWHRFRLAHRIRSRHHVLGVFLVHVTFYILHLFITALSLSLFLHAQEDKNLLSELPPPLLPSCRTKAEKLPDSSRTRFIAHLSSAASPARGFSHCFVAAEVLDVLGAGSIRFLLYSILWRDDGGLVGLPAFVVREFTAKCRREDAKRRQSRSSRGLHQNGKIHYKLRPLDFSAFH